MSHKKIIKSLYNLLDRFHLLLLFTDMTVMSPHYTRTDISNRTSSQTHNIGYITFFVMILNGQNFYSNKL